MNTTLYYFSGAGNSLQVARDLATELGETELVSIPKVMSSKIDTGSECIGIVFPVYCYSMPRMVTRFVDRLKSDKSKYFFAICTHGGTPGRTLQQTAKQFKVKDMKLSAGFAIQMPASAIITFEVEPEDKQQMYFSNAKQKIKRIAPIIKERKEHKIEKMLFLKNWMFRIVRVLFSNSMKNTYKGFWANEKCNGCGICVALCPTGNIRISNNKPEWGQTNCESCLACFNWCPKQSIQHKKKTARRGRYHNPNVKAKDLFTRELGNN